jgi:DNA-binding MarR family transcriptional regulator
MGRAMPTSRPPEDLGLTVLRSIRRILRQVSRYSRRVGRDTGLGVPQLLCLQAIAEAPEGSDVTVAYVADSVQLSRSTTSTLVDKLVKLQLVTRDRSERDRRRVHLQLTADGVRRLAGSPVPLEERFLERLAALDAEEQARIEEVLERLVQLMGAEDLDASPVLVSEADLG